MDKVIRCIHAVFPDADESALTPESRLGGIPGWDSMNSVNLLLELEAAFSVRLLNEMLSGDQRLADVVALLRSKGASA